MISLVVWIVAIVVLGIFFWWLLQQLPLPPPLQKIATIVIVAIGVIVLLGVLFQFAGSGIHIGTLR